MISVIIPTLWKPNFFESILEELENVKEVGEVIIISNDTPTFIPKGKKVRLLQQDKNLGVNASWNLGAKEATYENLVFLNDDFIVDSSFYRKALLASKDYGIIGINQDTYETKIKTITKMPYGFGCCFFLKKEDYLEIPEELFTFFGDDWLFNTCFYFGNKVGILPKIKTNEILSKSSTDYNHTIKSEQKIYFDKIRNIHKYKFSIVIAHYDGTKTDDELSSILQNIEDQTYKDFEVLLYHDGPESRPAVDLTKYSYPITYKATDIRYNDWGHSLRDMGIKAARGEYIINMNSDNTMYPQMLQKLYDASLVDEYSNFRKNTILIYPILACGKVTNGLSMSRISNLNKKVLLTGFPPLLHFIDAMQLVMKKSAWLLEGGWYDKSEKSDGKMYQTFVPKYTATFLNEVLGEHR